jgi:outer membrane translocation and assembly module TamA
MRIRIFIALLPLLPVTAVAQSQPAPPQGVYHIHKLSLESTDLSRPLRQNIVQAFQGGTYNLDALAERVRSKLRESGYEFAEVNGPQISRPRHAKYACDADVSFEVHAGNQYRLDGIVFTGNNGDTLFPSAQLRAQIPLEDGAIFNATTMGKGLENLRNLYADDGYANFGAIPKLQYDDRRQVVRLTIDMDHGSLVSFGKLFLEGVEPRAGVARQLQASWIELEGRCYNPQLLKDWFKENAASWPSDAAAQAHIEYLGGSPSAFNVMLHFQ